MVAAAINTYSPQVASPYIAAVPDGGQMALLLLPLLMGSEIALFTFKGKKEENGKNSHTYQLLPRHGGTSKNLLKIREHFLLTQMFEKIPSLYLKIQFKIQ